MYKILIADDHPLFREAIHNVISDGFPGSEVMETADLDSALALTQEHDDLDLILLDLNMPGMHGLNGLINLRNEAPTIPVVIVSAEQDKQIVLQAITYGAVGFITKSSPRQQMTEAIQQILNGNVYLPPDIIRTQNRHAPAPERNPELPAGTAPGPDPQAVAGAGTHDQGRVEQTDRLHPGNRRNHGEGPRLGDPAQAQRAQPGAGDPECRGYRFRVVFAADA
jgi:DNA-binding NarL/FixJ family response regulator